MDRGAHFYCTDFQVHTPRDRNWDGTGAVTEEERQEYAVEFIVACRQRGLDAVAITDHHDLAFVQYIRDAAKVERDTEGNILPLEKQIVVYPGMELTLGIPCQAILILDADFPEALFPLVETALAITSSPKSERYCAELKRLEDIKSFTQLYEILDRHDGLRGRYIILPNVSEGGKMTLMRDGHTGHYKDMPCVGGYLDGPISQVKLGNSNILTGKVPAYGNKALGLFPTSDCRRRDFSTLGDHVAFVKWATPTAEALRQACLARHSRISHEKPSTPPRVITAVNVSNSRFLGPVALDLNPQYNAIIGGRGTGKSSILEYLRWALCDDPIPAADGEMAENQEKRQRLIDKTLGEIDGNVQITLSVNGVIHVVRRHAKTKDIQLKVGTGNFEKVTEADVRRLLPIQAYSQKQLSSVGVRLEELKRFVEGPIRQNLDDISRRFENLEAALRTEYAQLRKKKRAEQNQRNLDRELRSLSEQIAACRDGLKGLEPGDQDVIARQATFEQADTVVTALRKDIGTIREECAGLRGLIARLPTRPITTILSGNLLPDDHALLASIDTHFRALLISIEDSLIQAEQNVQTATTTSSSFGEQVSKWHTRREEFRSAYEEARGRAHSHNDVLKQLSELEIRAKELDAQRGFVEAEIASTGDPESSFRDLQDRWKALHQERSTLIRKQCEHLTELSGGYIKVELQDGGGVKGLEERMRSIFSGARIAFEKIEKLSQKVREHTNSLDYWFEILGEFEILALSEEGGMTLARLSQIPELKNTFTESEIGRMIPKLTPDIWLGLSLFILDDEPSFLYQAREGEYIPFAEASAGQQATALLWALLNQDGPPLIIDQPEDDLDNQVILKVVEQIWKAKSKRQLIFTSHNANLVVNGDAELVVCCDYRVSGEQASGMIKYEGAIDIPANRDEIARVMEGGKDAFKLRMDKYGF